MSQLYGVVAHAALCRLLRTYKSKPFCSCCTAPTDVYPESKSRKRRRRVPPPSQTLEEFNADMLQFLQNHHLSVLDIEKSVQINGLRGRVDGIFIDSLNKRKLFIIDWKFSKYMYNNLLMEYVIQLNLYMYIMKRMSQYANFDYELYCFVISSSNNQKLKIFKVDILPEEFMANFITKSCYEIKIKDIT
ncbi:exonuclease [Drosophila suzukii associated hytrosavirus 1]|nr:exonuclease [Drosophila suzukii associated hytrosavirus 1]